MKLWFGANVCREKVALLILWFTLNRKNIMDVLQKFPDICERLLTTHLQNSPSKVLSDIASELQSVCNCTMPDSLETESLLPHCNSSCQQPLFYSMTVLVENVTELNATLHEWAASLNDSVTAGGIELVPDTACAPLLAATLPSPVCSVSFPVTTATSTSTVTTSETPTPRLPSSETFNPSDTGTASPDTNQDNLGIVLIVVIVLFGTLVLLILTVVIMMFFFLKRRRHVSDFAGEG